MAELAREASDRIFESLAEEENEEEEGNLLEGREKLFLALLGHGRSGFFSRGQSILDDESGKEVKAADFFELPGIVAEEGVFLRKGNDPQALGYR